MYWPGGEENAATTGDISVAAAIARLDDVAARYGVTPELEIEVKTPNSEAAFLESCRQVSREAVKTRRTLGQLSRVGCVRGARRGVYGSRDFGHGERRR
jgi:hypothetical protein